MDEALIGTGERIRRVLPKRARKPGAPDIEVAVTDKGRVVLFRCKSPCTPKHLDDILKDLPEGHKARQAVKKLRDELAKPDTKLTGDDAAGRLAKIADDHPDLPQLKKHGESLPRVAPEGLIKGSAEARQKVRPGQLAEAPHTETGGRPGHVKSSHGWDVNDHRVIDIRNNPDRIYISTNPKNPVIIFWKDGDVVITQISDTTLLRTAYGKSAPKRPNYKPDVWSSDPYFLLID